MKAIVGLSRQMLACGYLGRISLSSHLELVSHNAQGYVNSTNWQLGVTAPKQAAYSSQNAMF
jgi:hypothetical protein